MVKNSFGQKLKYIRKSKNLTQAQLAEISGTNEKHISKIETGVYFPTYATLVKILDALELGFDDLVVESARNSNENPYYLKSLQILNAVKSEKEFEIYYGCLKQTKEAIRIMRDK